MLRMDKMRQSLAGVRGFVPRKVVALGLVVMLSVAGVCIFRTFAPRTGAASAVRVAQIVTDYPGASAETVAARVTDPVETAAERMGRVRRTASTSYPGRSVVTVELRDDVPAEAVPQAWDELQRRVGGTPLPPGCSAPVVNEDYGEVYDVVYALSGDGFSPADLKAYAKALRRDLRLCADVAKVDLLGDRQQIVSLEISRAKIAALGLSPETVAAALAGRTVPTDAGSLRLGDKRIRLDLAPRATTLEDLVRARLPDGLALGDVCAARFDYADPPAVLVRRKGRPCVALALSAGTDGDVARMGHAVARRLRERLSAWPVGLCAEVLATPSGRLASGARHPQFVVSVWLPEGTAIERTDGCVAKVADFLAKQDGVTGVTSIVGAGLLRLSPTEFPEDPNPAYGLLLVDVDDAGRRAELMRQIAGVAPTLAPDADVVCRRLRRGREAEPEVRVRLFGPDLARLRALGEEACAILRAEGRLMRVQTDWRNRADVIEPVICEVRAAKLGLDRAEIARAFRFATDGVTVGAFPLGDEMLPIVLRAKRNERDTLVGVRAAWLWRTDGGGAVPLAQLVDAERQTSEERRVRRRDGQLCLTVTGDPRDSESVAAAWSRVRPALAAFAARLPSGYRMSFSDDE